MAKGVLTSDEALQTGARVNSVDVLRGLIMMLMVIDHVRVYSGVSPGGPDPAIFFTRWITHFCAPGFAFLAGTSAFLYGRKIQDTGKLARYLLTRGLLLVILEITVIRLFWTFNLNIQEFFLAGVVWMLGWCMVCLSAFVRVSPAIIGMVGAAIIFLQSLFALIPGLLPAPFAPFWEFIYTSGNETWEGITVLYVLIPWIGVMMAGYGFGLVLSFETQRRKRICLWGGLIGFFVFLAASTFQLFQEPAGSDDLPFILRLLNQRKYPASPLYLLMTLGPLIALIPFAEKAQNRLTSFLQTLGKVPLFFYLLHILLIHLTALLVNVLRYGGAHQEWYNTAPYTYMPETFERWSLPLLYLVFLIDLIILFLLCRWYGRFKMNHPEKAWLKYL